MKVWILPEIFFELLLCNLFGTLVEGLIILPAISSLKMQRNYFVIDKDVKWFRKRHFENRELISDKKWHENIIQY